MLPITLGKNKTAEALIDSGAQSCYMSSQLARELQAPIKQLPKLILVWNVDGTRNKSDAMTHYTIIPIKIGDLQYRQMFYIVAIGQQKMILGFKWLKKFNPEIQWETSKMVINKPQKDVNDHWIRKIHETDDHEWIRDIREEEPRIWIRKSQVKINLLKEHKIRRISAMNLARTIAKQVVKMEVKQQIPKEYHQYLKVFEKKPSERLPEHKP